MRDSAIVIPCFNEERRLSAEEILHFADQHRDLHFLLVNDASQDRTAALIDDLHSHLPDQCHALHLPANLGKAGAVRAGFLEAFRLEYPVIGFWDADLSTPLAEILAFRRLLANGPCEMVLGARVKLLSRPIERQLSRHYLGRIFATLASLTLGETVYDTQCGAKLFANTPRLRQVFSLPFTVGWIFDVEILARFVLLARHGAAPPLARIACEQPLCQWRDVPGSKVNVLDFVKAAVELAKVWNNLRGPGSKGYYEALARAGGGEVGGEPLFTRRRR